MSAHADFYPRRWGLGFELVFESYFMAAWITLGPLVFWVEWT